MILTNDFLENLYTRIATVKGKLSGASPNPLPALTTNDGLLEAIVKEADDTVVEAARYKGHAHDSVENAYSMTLPQKIYQWNGVKSIGGRTIVWNQQRRDDTASNTSDGITTKFDADTGLVSITNNSRTTNFGSGSTQVILVTGYAVPIGHKQLAWTDAPDLTGLLAYKDTNTSYPFNEIITTVATNGSMRLRVTKDYDFVTKHPIGDTYSFHINIFDLTLMFGAGNEPATVEEFLAMFPANFYACNKGELMNAGVTEVANAETYTVPTAIKNLAGYGLSCPASYNYIDFENKKYMQNVANRAYASGDESDATMVTDKTTTNYPLTTPVETDISAYLPGDVVPNPQAGSTITFKTQLGDDYRIPVPVLVDYVGR